MKARHLENFLRPPPNITAPICFDHSSRFHVANAMEIFTQICRISTMSWGCCEGHSEFNSQRVIFRESCGKFLSFLSISLKSTIIRWWFCNELLSWNLSRWLNGMNLNRVTHWMSHTRQLLYRLPSISLWIDESDLVKASDIFISDFEQLRRQIINDVGGSINANTNHEFGDEFENLMLFKALEDFSMEGCWRRFTSGGRFEGRLCIWQVDKLTDWDVGKLENSLWIWRMNLEVDKEWKKWLWQMQFFMEATVTLLCLFWTR